MYTKIKIEFDGKEIVFGAHEVVKIAQAVTKREMEKCLGTEHYPQIQDHEIYVASLNERLSRLSSILFNLYEKKYNFRPGVIKQFLDEIREANNNSFMIIGLTTRRWKQLLDISKTKKEADREFVGFAGKEVTKGFLPIPPVIKGLNSQANFYFLIKHLSKEVAKSTFNGWWVLIAGRVIHINYQPVTAEGERGQHYYVSDHGTLDNVTDQITNVTLSHKLFAGENHMNLMTFFKAFDRLGTEQKANLRENFINFLRELNLGDEELIEFLLVNCSLSNGLTMHNWKVFTEKWPVALKKYMEFHGKFIDKPKAESIIDDEYKKCEAAYEVTLERARYKTQVRLIPSIKEQYTTGTVYSRQVRNVMTENDADTFMECKFLTGLASEVSLGDRSKLLRPLDSYGDRHSGSSYHDFERALVNYQARPAHLHDAQLAVLMRRVLAGETPSLPHLNFVPNLVGAWFIAESVRNPTAFLSGVILLDMIENGVQLLDTNGNNWYCFRGSLVHPLKSSGIGKVPDLYGSKVGIDRFGGSHPMAHGGSVTESQEELLANTKLTTVRQKEANLILHWLHLYLKQLGITSHLMSEKLKTKDVNFDELATEDKDSPKLEQLKKKAKKLEDTINPNNGLRMR